MKIMKLILIKNLIFLILFDITFDKLSYIKLLNQISNLTRLNSHIVIVSSYDWSNDEEEDEGRMIVFKYFMWNEI